MTAASALAFANTTWISGAAGKRMKLPGEKAKSPVKVQLELFACL